MSFKRFSLSQDVQSLLSPVNEVVSISGSVFFDETKVKKYRNIATASAGPEYDLGGYWQTVFDGAPTSTQSSALFDVTYGYATGSSYNVAVTTSASQNEKIKMYRHHAKLLLGDPDALFSVGSADKQDCFFVCFKRNLQRDELKKGSVKFTINSISLTSGRAQYTASDDGAVTSYKQTIGGDYAPLYLSGSGGTAVGQVWYNAGIVVIPADLAFGATAVWSASMANTLINMQASSSINELCDGFRKHVERIDFHNQTNLYSQVFFCRALNNEFNYSSNPTFVDSNKKIRVTSGSNILQTRTYVTTIGLYDVNDNLLAVAKVNKPILKSPDTETIFRVRLDY